TSTLSKTVSTHRGRPRTGAALFLDFAEDGHRHSRDIRRRGRVSRLRRVLRYSAEWPRFSLEIDADLARIPRALVDDERGRMRCEGNRCAALSGEVGVATLCAVYTPFFFIPVFLAVACTYLVLPVDLFVVQIAACAASFYAHVFFDKEY